MLHPDDLPEGTAVSDFCVRRYVVHVLVPRAPALEAGTLGDGNGWTAAVTIRSFVARGWIEPRWNPGLPSWMRAYRITEEGLHALRSLDAQWPAERCPACMGESMVRNNTSHWTRIPDGMCSTCEGTRLVRRAVR